MNDQSISAYDFPERVLSYDDDMKLMHPNRNKMIDIALEILPFHPNSSITALDLGCGTGYFSKNFLQQYSEAKIIAIDGAESMVDLAKVRLAHQIDRVAFRVGDFRELSKHVPGVEDFDVIYSSYALHHLDQAEKLEVIRQSVILLKSGGWFLNADLIVAESKTIEMRIQEMRVAGIVRRAQEGNSRFADMQSTRRFLDELEKNEGDQPLTLLGDLKLLKKAGLNNSSVFWSEYREAVTGGVK